MNNPAPRIARHRVTKRASNLAPTATGPRLAAMPEEGRIVVRPLAEGERPAFPRAVLVADENTAEAIRLAGEELAQRVRRLGATLPVKVLA